jgi:Lrp/AsnC family transcriptional regulator, leucine-responsive regulatory protein
MNGVDAELSKLLDGPGLKILSELRRDARQTLSAISRKVKMSLPAVSERVRRMEEAGIIRGYHAQVDLGALGYTMTVFIRMKTAPERYSRFTALVESLPEVLECHHVSGEDSFILKLAVRSIPHLERMIGKLSGYGQTSSSIVLSTLPQKARGSPGSVR